MGRTTLALSLLALSQTEVKAADNSNSSENPEDAPICDTSNLQPPPECIFLNDQGPELPPEPEVAVIIPTTVTSTLVPPPTPTFHFNLNLEHAQNLDEPHKQELARDLQNSYNYYTQTLHDGPDHDVAFNIINDAPSPNNQVARNDGKGRILLWTTFPGWNATGSYGLPGEAYRQSIIIHEELHQIQNDAYLRGLPMSGQFSAASFSLSEGWATREGYEGAATVLHLDPMTARRCTLLNLKKSDGINFEYVSDINHAGAFIGTESGRAYDLSYIGVVELEKAAAPAIADQGGRMAAMRNYFADVGTIGSEASLLKHYNGIGTPIINQLVIQAVNSFSGSCP